MFPRPSRSLMLRVVATALVALPFATHPILAQTSTPGEFSSSTQALLASLEPVSSRSAAPAIGGGQSYQAYGSNNGFVNHLTFEGGGGFNAPIGNDTPFITWGGNVNLGGGFRFNNRLSLLAEYQFIDDKLPGSLIAEANAQGGDAHIWSFTLDPVLDLFPKHKDDLYLTGGGGFYRKLTSFTDPEETIICGYFCYPGYENVIVSHFSSNQGGLNLGLGITRRLGSPDMGGDERLKLFAEARYIWIDTPKIGTTDGLGRTELLPVTLGLRW